MKTFLVKLVFQVQVDSTPVEFEEQYWSVPATDEGRAFEAGRTIGRKEEGAVQGPDQRPITWTFVDVAEIIAPGDDRFAQHRFTRTSQADPLCAESYIRHIKARAMHLQVKNLTFA